jgi:hypothetical protein
MGGVSHWKKLIDSSSFIESSVWELILLHNVHVALGTEKVLIHFLPGFVAPQTHLLQQLLLLGQWQHVSGTVNGVDVRVAVIA